MSEGKSITVAGPAKWVLAMVLIGALVYLWPIKAPPRDQDSVEYKLDFRIDHHKPEKQTPQPQGPIVDVRD